MILTSLIFFASYVVKLILTIFPNSTGFPAEVHTAVAYIGGYVGILDPLVPLSTMATIISLIIVFELAVFGFKAFKWIFSHVPLIGGKG